jgi:hypothetical protein
VALAGTVVTLAWCAGATSARADAYLNDWCFNVNGANVVTASCNQGPPVSLAPNVNGSNFDFTLNNPSGTPNTLGSVLITLAPGNNQFALAYMDYDLNYPNTGSFSDFGSVVGTPPAGVTYELDDPNVSNIFNDFSANALTDQNNVATPGRPPNICCDVSWALGVGGINVPTGDQALVTFTVATTPPASGFYLQQTNQTPTGANGESIYLSETTTLEQTAAPEPASIALLGSGLIAFGLLRHRWRKLG